MAKWCDETIEVEIDGKVETLRCTSDFDSDGDHRFETHRAVVYWGDPS